MVVLLCAAAALGQDKPTAKLEDKKDESSGDRLIRKAVSQAEEDLMDGIIRMMEEAAGRLEIDFDAGEDTQAVQRRVLEKLDDAIREAASQRRLQRRKNRPFSGDKRRMAKGSKRSAETGTTPDGADSASSSDLPHGESAGAERPPSGGDLRELRQSWGHLPLRQREAIIQGIRESYLERYRDWIERYYRALQETED